MKLISSSLFVLCLSACAGNGQVNYSSADAPASDQEESAQISSYQIKGKQLQFAVESSGCTFYSSFELQKGDLENSVEIRRVQADKCAMRKHTIELTYPLGGLGLDFKHDIVVVNAVKTDPQLEYSIESDFEDAPTIEDREEQVKELTGQQARRMN